MTEISFCHICLDNNVRMHQITGSEVQDVYEKILNKKLQEDGRLYFACYICYCQLKNCQQLVIKFKRSEELQKQILANSSEPNLESIPFLDRLTYGLQNSLMVAQIQTFQIPEYSKVIKNEDQGGNGTTELVVKVEPDDESASKEHKLDEKHMFDQDKATSIECVKKENMPEIQTDTASDKNMSIQVEFDGKSVKMEKDVPKYFMCNDCGETCDTKALLTKHIIGHTTLIIKPNIKIEKSRCERKSTESDNSKKDLSIDPCEKPFKCQYCNYRSAHVISLEAHIKTHTGENLFKCRYCSYASTRNDALMEHVITHTRENSFQCRYCEYTCARYNALKIHIIKMHTEDKPFKCPYCSYASKRKGDFRNHINTHTGENLFKCHYCNYATARNDVLKRHILTHTGEKPFKCQYCTYKCAGSYDLKTHMKTHTGENLFKCQHCSYVSTRKCSFKNHMKRHTRENPFKCQYCSYASARNDILKRHLKTHTGKKPFKCQYCSYTCARSLDLKTHIRTHTGENLNVNTVTIDVQ